MNDTPINTLPPQLNTYPVFEANQVLTNAHLNEMRDYLMEQDRLSRVYLIGMGILSGFHLKSDMKTFVDVSGGCGVTSHGYLASFDTKHLTKHRKYQDPAGYLYFKNGKVIDIWELVTDDFIPEPSSSPVVDIGSTSDFLINKLALVYVESYDKDLKSCLGEGCDDKGKKRIINIRVLLIDQKDLPVIKAKAQEETEHPFDLAKEFCSTCILPDIPIKRLLLDPCPTTEDELYNQYFILCDDAIPKIASSLKQAYLKFKPILQTSGFDIGSDTSISSILKGYFDAIRNSSSEKHNIQYFYDFLLDLQLAYTEFRDSVYKLSLALGYSMNYSVNTARFPMHLMLGELDADNCCDTPVTRQTFLRAPVTIIDPDERNKSVFLWKRIKQMLDNFLVIHDCPARITPSREKNTPLSERSIPYYYKITGEDASLHHRWNNESEKTCLSNRLLSYHSDQYNKNEYHVTNPLLYSVDRYSFFRIEGHIGTNYDSLSGDLNHQIRVNNLPIRILTLPIKSNNLSIENDNFYYEDLQEDYFFHRNKLLKIIDGIQSYYDLLIKEDSELRDPIKKNFDEETTLKSLDSFEKDVYNRFKSIHELLPLCLKDFSYEAFKAFYKKCINDILDYFYVDQKLFVQAYCQLSIKTKGDGKVDWGNNWIGFAHKALYEFINFLYHTRLYHIYYSFKLRQTRGQTTFGAFVSQWPGCEHQAGVIRGGTFILVYNSFGEVIADFSLPHFCYSIGLNAENCKNENDLMKIPVPPFAKPDYVLTYSSKSITIKSIFNDDANYGDTIKIKSFNGKSDELIKIEKSTGKSQSDNVRLINADLVYSPPTDFIGTDRFEYTIESLATGMTDKAIVTVFVVPNLVPVATVKNSCYGSGNGSITVTVKGLTGKEDLEYSIHGNGSFQKENTFSNLPMGNYSLMVRDNITKMTSERINLNVEETTQLLVNVEVANPRYQGSNDGSIIITAQGGSGNFSYSLNGKVYAQNTFINLKPGSYEIQVLDKDGCTSDVIKKQIQDPGLLTIDISVSQASNQNTRDGQITIYSKGSGNYLFYLNEKEGVQGGDVFIISKLLPGSYDVIVKDLNWNLAVRKTNIIVNAPKVIDAFISKWGGYGTDPGLFSHMEGIAIDITNQFIYIADTDNNRIQKFTTAGKLLKIWGSLGTNAGQFKNPTCVKRNRINSDVFVLDLGNMRIQKFTSEGLIVKWAVGGVFDLKEYNNLGKFAVDASGSILLPAANKIHKISPAGDKIAPFAQVGVGPISDISIDGSDNVFVSSPNDRRIFKFDKLGNALPSLAPTQTPFSLAIDTKNRLYMSDSNQEIHLLSSTGSSVSKFGGSEGPFESVDGLFRNIYDFVLDEIGQIYVTDFDKNIVQKFKPM